MIREKFRAKGIPEDMYFLGLVESGYDPNAYSRAAAVGMWQFMTTTARGVGLRVDWWVDERRDPVRATDAAATFIDILNKQFGSYYLAAAAYNGGPGRVSRGLAKFQDELEEVAGDDKFFALAEQQYLRPETKNYVPQLIAAALIGKEPSKYGMPLDSVAPFAYDSVSVPALTPLSAISIASGAPLAALRDLNPHYLRGVTPPDRVSTVRVPVGAAGSFGDRFAAVAESERTAFSKVVTTKGQTLAMIGAAHDVSAKAIAWFNRKLRYVRKGRLAVGQSVLVPRPHVVAGAADVPDPAIERYGSSSAARTSRTVHVVKRGDNLGGIARRYKTTIATLVRLNALKKRIVYPGQSIIVRGSRAAPRRATGTARRPATEAPAKKAPAKKPTAKPRS